MPAPAHAAGPFATGLVDGVFVSSDTPLRDEWLGRAHDAGAQSVLVVVSWAGVAPAKPVSPTDPNDPAYHWETFDAALHDAVARGLDPVLSLTQAPAWAEGGHRPKNALAGSWKPDPAAFGQFAEAAARRYSGLVHHWQIWGEPNLSSHLAPQWMRSHGRFVPASPTEYRALLNAGYAAIKRVQPAAVVITAGTAPYGDLYPGQARMQPARFWREVLCVSGPALRPSACRVPAHFDVLSHHPYSIGRPARRALNADDVSIADMGKLTQILHAAERTGRALPRGPKAVWVTEMSWDSRPPDPQGVPEATQARWLDEALWLLWRQGVSRVFWFQIRDEAPDPSYAATYQSGLFFRGGKPKLARRAFAFPFVAEPSGHGRATLWGLAPQAGTVVLEARRGSGWRRIATVRTTRGRVFEATRRLARRSVVRARQGRTASLPFRIV